MEGFNQQKDAYGVHDQMRRGFPKTVTNSTDVHPVEKSEKEYFRNMENQEFKMLRTTQGLHMPMHLKLERSVAAKMQRLPGLPSSHLHLRTLLQMQDTIGPEDIFNCESESEAMGDYRAMCDQKLGFGQL